MRAHARHREEARLPSMTDSLAPPRIDPAPDDANDLLARDVHVLGTILGDVLREVAGDDAFELVEEFLSPLTLVPRDVGESAECPPLELLVAELGGEGEGAVEVFPRNQAPLDQDFA